MTETEQKRAEEQRTVLRMIRIYCNSRHGKGSSKDLCPECKELADYALFRLEKCPNMESKTFCSACKTSCYRTDMRERIRNVMRYSGPRMIFYDPVATLKHVWIVFSNRLQKSKTM